jgi:ketosteroid isomerase-like protein
VTESNNMTALKEAYRRWDTSKGASKEAWLELMADEVRIRSVNEHEAGLSFAKNRYSRNEAVDYLAALLKDWEMIHWTPDTFVEDGNRIAMFGRCAWTFRDTGASAEVDIAHLWQFDGNKIIELREVFDSAKAIAAASMAV